MYGGVLINKLEEKYSVSLSGCLNNTGTQYYSYNKQNLLGLGEINFETLLMCWAKSYVGLNRALPDHIILYQQELNHQFTPE